MNSNKLSQLKHKLLLVLIIILFYNMIMKKDKHNNMKLSSIQRIILFLNIIDHGLELIK